MHHSSALAIEKGNEFESQKVITMGQTYGNQSERSEWENIKF